MTERVNFMQKAQAIFDGEIAMARLQGFAAGLAFGLAALIIAFG